MFKSLSPDGKSWLQARQDYLFPVLVLGSLFRGKILDALKRAEDLDLPEDLQGPGAMVRLRSRLFEKNWIVYAKPPFGGPKEVYRYLGRYTHRVGLSNHRILGVKSDAVTISTRGEKTATLKTDEFIRRYLLHVLPRAFVKIRHYGLFASSNIKTRLKIARDLLRSISEKADQAGSARNAAAPLKDAEPAKDWRTLLEQFTAVSPPPSALLAAASTGSACPSREFDRRQRRQAPHRDDLLEPQDLYPKHGSSRRQGSAWSGCTDPRADSAATD